MTVLSHKALGITQAEHRALLEIRELFAGDQFHHDPGQCLDRPNGFNMNVAMDEGECGTSGCIGGWMHAAMTRDHTAPCVRVSEYVNSGRSRALGPLFYPFTDHNFRDLKDQDGQSWDFPYELIPPVYALKAIDNFLSTGDPDWPSACGLRNLEVRPDVA
jgi:hypothetical protein